MPLPSNSQGAGSGQDATVYTIYAGMIPTLGFDRGDFHPDRAGSPTGVKSKAVSLGMSISPMGRQRKARVRGSVAWYEYSTTVRAIHEEVLGGDNQGSDAHEVLRWPRGWKSMFESGISPAGGNIAEDFTNQIGASIRPTGESHSGTRGTTSEQSIADADDDWRLWKADDGLAREQGRLVNRANSIDMYFRGRDNNIYRIDVTSMNMNESKEGMETHHGLSDLADRQQRGVDSDSLLASIAGGDMAGAERRLLNYFQGRTNEYNNVIRTLKDHLRNISGRGDFLDNLDLGDSNQLEQIRADLEASFRRHGSTTEGNQQKTDPMSQLRPNLNEAMSRMSGSARLRRTARGSHVALESAVVFALHALGNVVQSKAVGSQGTATEYRIGRTPDGNPWTIGVLHTIINSGASVLEFAGLKRGDVRIYNEESLENAFIRANLQVTGQAADRIIHRANLDRNFQESAFVASQDNSAVQVGDVVAASFGNISRDAHNIHLGAQVIISPRDFNTHIETWIQNVGTGRGWRQRVHSFLQRYLYEGPEIEQRNRGNNVRNRFAQIASPIRAAQEGPRSINTFNMLASEDTTGKSGYERDLFALDISGAERGSPEMMDLISQRGDAMPMSGAFRRGRESWRVAGDLLRGASGMNEHDWEQNQRFAIRKDSESMKGMETMPGMDRYAGDRSMGVAQMTGVMEQHRERRPQQFIDRQRKYWGLQEYLSRDSQSGFDDNVSPSWWAAPYISIFFPSGQLGSRT